MTPSVAVKFEIEERLAVLPLDLQNKVLEFTRSLASVKGTRGAELLEFAGQIPPSDCAIKEGCESVERANRP
jgi:hypothetical protein